MLGIYFFQSFYLLYYQFSYCYVSEQCVLIFVSFTLTAFHNLSSQFIFNAFYEMETEIVYIKVIACVFTWPHRPLA